MSSSNGISSSANLPSWMGFKSFCKAITRDIVDGSDWRKVCLTYLLISIHLAADSILCKYADSHPEIDFCQH